MSKSTVTPATAADVRAWAKENGHTVGERGRFANALVAAYNASPAGKAAPYAPERSGS